MNSIDLLWDPSGTSWRSVGVRTNSAMQLFSFDLQNKSDPIFWNDDMKALVLDAATQQGYAAPGTASS